jgi:hypothetical protein
MCTLEEMYHVVCQHWGRRRVAHACPAMGPQYMSQGCHNRVVIGATREMSKCASCTWKDKLSQTNHDPNLGALSGISGEVKDLIEERLKRRLGADLRREQEAQEMPEQETLVQNPPDDRDPRSMGQNGRYHFKSRSIVCSRLERGGC